MCEEEEVATLLRIGMFSKLGKTTVKTLRHYDEVGLLAPGLVDEETGYRYYATGQLARLHEIVALRQMGFSIPEISDILDGRQVEEILRARKEALILQQQEANDRLFRLNHYLQSRKGGTSMQYQAVLKEIPSYTVLSYQKTLPNFGGIQGMIQEMEAIAARTNPGLVCLEPAYCFMVYLDGEYRETDIHAEYCQAVAAPGKDGEGIVFKQLPATEVVSVLHQGAYDGLGAAYAFAFQWMEANGYEPTEHPRERYIEGIWNRRDVQEWITEVQIPVKRK